MSSELGQLGQHNGHHGHNGHNGHLTSFPSSVFLALALDTPPFVHQVLQVWYQRGALLEHSQAVGKALQHVKSLGPVRTEEEQRAEMQRHEVRPCWMSEPRPLSRESVNGAVLIIA